MTAKEYLMQAKYLSQRIHSKTCQLQELRDLAVTVTQVLSDMPKSQKVSSRIEETVAKIIDYQDEIAVDIKDLVAIEKEISERISQLDKTEYQLILTERYLEGKDWHEIAEDMHYTTRWVQSLHGEALQAMQAVLDAAV